jgi:membrane protease YdiL (CAAX protease family)
MPDTRSVSLRVGLYVLLTFAFSAYFDFRVIRAGHLDASGGIWVVGLMWCPAAAAIVASLLTGRSLREIGWRWSWRYAGLAYAIPLAYALVAYGAAWALGFCRVPDPVFAAALYVRFPRGSPAASLAEFLLLQATVGVLFACFTGLGEEIGWRGFLVPELSRRASLPRTALISGGIWAVWHYPLLVFADYNGGTRTWFSLLCFTVLVLGISFLFAWIRLASGSVWPAAILHGSHNLWIQEVFDPLTGDTGMTSWILGEFGVALALSGIVVGWLAWRAGRRLAPLAEAEAAA